MERNILIVDENQTLTLEKELVPGTNTFEYESIWIMKNGTLQFEDNMV